MHPIGSPVPLFFQYTAYSSDDIPVTPTSFLARRNRAMPRV